MVTDLLQLTAIIVIQLMSLIMKITSPQAQFHIAPLYGQCEQSLAAVSLRVTEASSPVWVLDEEMGRREVECSGLCA